MNRSALANEKNEGKTYAHPRKPVHVIKPLKSKIFLLLMLIPLLLEIFITLGLLIVDYFRLQQLLIWFFLSTIAIVILSRNTLKKLSQFEDHFRIVLYEDSILGPVSHKEIQSAWIQYGELDKERTKKRTPFQETFQFRQIWSTEGNKILVLNFLYADNAILQVANHIGILDW
jgi:hypothetical protein